MAGYGYGYEAYGADPYAGYGYGDPYGGGYGDPYGGGYADPYGGGYGDPYGGGYGDPYGGYGDPYGGGYGGGYEDYYYPLDYYDALAGEGYYGPWPQDFYEPRPPPPPRGGCCCDDEPDDCCCSRPRRRMDDCHDIGDLLERFERDLDTKLGGGSRRGDCGLTGQWQRILDKFPDKKARIVEIDDEEALDRRARLQKKRAAEARRDRLLEAIAFNGDAPVPGKSNAGPSNQVVHIDFGGGNRQAPGGGPVPGGHPGGHCPPGHGGYRPPGPGGFPPPGPNVARAYSHSTVPVGYPQPGQPQILYQ